jgi:hypothetical protein
MDGFREKSEKKKKEKEALKESLKNAGIKRGLLEGKAKVQERLADELSRQLDEFWNEHSNGIKRSDQFRTMATLKDEIIKHNITDPKVLKMILKNVEEEIKKVGEE